LRKKEEELDVLAYIKNPVRFSPFILYKEPDIVSSISKKRYLTKGRIDDECICY
jgi:hypothetical protein